MQHLAAADGTVTLRQFHFDHLAKLFVEPPEGITREDLVHALVLDTETTGLDPDIDEVVEIALLSCWFDKRTGALYHVDDPPQVMQQEPSKPLSEEIQKITGITDEMLKGKAIHWPLVQSRILEADIVLAHNAKFDRGFVDRILNIKSLSATSAVWGCSWAEVEWTDVPANKLEILVPWLTGVWYPAHRADIDVLALVYLLAHQNKLAGLYAEACKHSYEIQAWKAPRELKDLLKRRRYQWDGKVWWKDGLSAEKAKEEILYLAQNIYMCSEEQCTQIAKVAKKAPHQRFGIGG